MIRAVTVHGKCIPRGDLLVPGDKSISHRLALLAPLCRGVSRIDGFLDSEDCRNTLAAMQALGAVVERDGSSIIIQGLAGRLEAPAHPLDMGNSGTGMRLLAGILAAQPFPSVLTGDASLSSRPMLRIAGPLREMGARLELDGERGCAPIRIQGGALNAVTYRLPVASAQVKSCVLLAGLFARGMTTVIEPALARDHTERLLRMLDAPVTVDNRSISLEGSGGKALDLKARAWNVPGDFSSAAFWIVAAMMPGADLRILNLGMNPRRTAFLDWMRRMGAVIEVEAGGGVSGDRNDPERDEPVGCLHVRGGNLLRGAETCTREIPNLIDELPLVAVAGALAEGVTSIRDAAELRVKESDRIAIMARNLSLMGVQVDEYPDGMMIKGSGGCIPGGCTVDTLGDHRVAMAMAVMAGFAERPVKILNPECTETSYPGFWQTMERMGASVQYSRGD